MNKFDAELIATIKKQRLQKMLSNSDFKWRTLSSLAKAIGEPESATQTILRSIGAKQGRKRRTGAVLYQFPG